MRCSEVDKVYSGDPLLTVILSVSFLFIVFLVVKDLIRSLDFCAICFSVSATWTTLLALNLLGYFSDRIIIALLMGQSVTGIYYMIEKRVQEGLRVLSLPFLLTLTYLAYLSLNTSKMSITSTTLLIGLWIIFLTIYMLRSSQKIKRIATRVIECCKNW